MQSETHDRFRQRVLNEERWAGVRESMMVRGEFSRAAGACCLPATVLCIM